MAEGCVFCRIVAGWPDAVAIVPPVTIHVTLNGLGTMVFVAWLCFQLVGFWTVTLFVVSRWWWHTVDIILDRLDSRGD